MKTVLEKKIIHSTIQTNLLIRQCRVSINNAIPNRIDGGTPLYHTRQQKKASIILLLDAWCLTKTRPSSPVLKSTSSISIMDWACPKNLKLSTVWIREFCTNWPRPKKLHMLNRVELISISKGIIKVSHTCYCTSTIDNITT